ncbi:Sec34-like family-domain-containing protein [Lineolata rhizophorae]|uniref:Conserved oligomeric Golgi complex subunit 3 n=1 Tax=Lineolata rhizophorae TaxID=578093 RepID=A0A6A6P620_9PEZI|nr:Sec34-like family-domain-containing protein [Lineolata rhizophorae]
MYEDHAWYNPFASKSTVDVPSQVRSGRRRRTSLLQQPNEAGSQADTAPVDGIKALLHQANAFPAPPPATVARRAKSYSDFYDIVRSHLRKEKAALERRDRLDQFEQRKRRPKTKELKDLKSELDFGDWYAGVSDGLVDASHTEYHLYLDQLRLAESHLDSLLASTTSSLDILTSLSDSFKAVDAQTAAFQEQCEGVLSDQKRISALADDIAENLQYYNYLEPITRKLNAPGAGNFVRSREYSEMLSNLDNCVDYMQNHPNHLESATYRSRYRLLLTRALTLIRVHFTNTLRETAADVSRRIADRQLNDTTMSALLYAKFRVGAPEMKRVGMEIQKRAVLPAGAELGAEAEYQSLMNELYQSYSATRGRLILPIIAKKMNEIAMAPSTAKDLVAFARSCISYIRGICLDEYDLWGEWFTTDGALYDFLEAICEPLYDHLRPHTIHETQLLKLCELCALIQTRYMEDDEDDEEEVLLDEPVRKLDFSALIRPALADAQTRLVFLALAVIRDDIEYYKPKPDDLEYPAGNKQQAATHAERPKGPVLSGKKSNGTSMPHRSIVIEAEDGAQTILDTEAAYAGWYPTLRKAIWLLSRIYRLVNSTVFDDLAHQIVHQTVLSFNTAAAQIAKRHSPTDAQLFLIRHLLLLKQQIVTFDIEFVTPEVGFDFTTATNTFWELRERGGLFNPANLVRLVLGGKLMPRVVENMLDAKAELDGRLRTVINDFTGGFANRMTGSVAKGKTEYKGFNPTTAVAAVRSEVETQVPFLRKKLDEYLEDRRTKETLVAAVMDLTVERYEEFVQRREQGEGNKRGAGMKKLEQAKGKGREDGIWDPDLFSDWCAGVFGVGKIGGGYGRGGDEEGMSSGSRSVSRSGSM